MSIALIATGALLQVGDGASPENFATVPEVHRLSGPDVRVDLIDVSSHDSSGGFREYLPGFKDGDNVQAEVHWVPSNTVHKGIRTDAYAAALRNYHIIFPDATDNTVTFACYVQGFPPQSNAGDALRNTLNLKITGEPLWSTT
jgi:predicted secreted protein